MQCEYNNAIIDLRPKLYYHNKNNAQSITFPYGTSISVDYYGVLPYISVRKSKNYEVGIFEQIALTSKSDWDPYGKGGVYIR